MEATIPAEADARASTNVWANIWWGASRGVALACLPVAFRMLQSGYLASRVPGVAPVEGRLQVDLATFALGAGLGVVAGLFRPLTRSLAGSLLFGVLLVEIGALGLSYFVRRSTHSLQISTFVAAGLFGLLLGAAAYLSRQTETRQV